LLDGRCNRDICQINIIGVYTTSQIKRLKSSYGNG
jgi:hypothetical protein